MREYDNVTLKKVQQAELSILKDFINVCEENGLSYFGFAGTGIGALRHGGFIPWDDDIDVGLLRADYDKVLDIFKRDFSDKYIVVNAEEFDTYPLMTTRICLKDSKFIEESLRKLDCPLGIFLDVYAFENVASDKAAAERQAFGAWLFSKLLILKHIPFPVLPFRGIKRKLAYCVTATVWALLNLFCVSHKFLYNKAKKYNCKYMNENADRYAYFCSTDRWWNIFEKEDLLPLRTEKFEGIDLYFPRDLEKHLTWQYNDYMQLPPPEKRKNHFPFVLKFPGEEAELRNE